MKQNIRRQSLRSRGVSDFDLLAKVSEPYQAWAVDRARQAGT